MLKNLISNDHSKFFTTPIHQFLFYFLYKKNSSLLLLPQDEFLNRTDLLQRSGLLPQLKYRKNLKTQQNPDQGSTESGSKTRLTFFRQNMVTFKAEVENWPHTLPSPIPILVPHSDQVNGGGQKVCVCVGGGGVRGPLSSRAGTRWSRYLRFV
jgi:hypothetical protein